MFLKVYWRTYLRHNLNPADYFIRIREKYGDEFSYSEMNTITVKVTDASLADFRKLNFVVTTDSCVVIKEMVGTMNVESESHARELADQLDDCVFAEYVSQFRFDRCPV